MIAQQVAEILSVFFVICDLDEDEVLESRSAEKALDYVSFLFSKMDKDFVKELKAAFPKIAEQYEGESRELLRTIPEGLDFDAIIAGEYDE